MYLQAIEFSQRQTISVEIVRNNPQFPVVLTIAIFVVAALIAAGIVYLIIRTIYRLATYTYKTRTFSAKVVSKVFSEGLTLYYPVYMPQSNIYSVNIKTPNGLTDTIDSEKLYHNIKEGDEITVKMKVGYNNRGQLKYWKILSYKW